MSEASVRRQRVIYSGRVQGVGFRATTASIARRHPVAGFVRNLADGTVELVVEGAPTPIDALLAEIDEAMAGYVKDRSVETIVADEPLPGFEIRH